MTLDDLEGEIRNLSDADFSRLARRLGLNPLGDLQWAQVTIDDGRNGETPIAIIKYADGSKQKLDIFAAIRENIMTIGNPIVLIAIHHWHEIIRHRAALTFKDVWNSKEGEFGEASRGLTEHYHSGLPEIAYKNLDRISEAISESAKDGSSSREEAFVACVQHYGYDKEDTLLYKAFEWLRDNKTRNDIQKLN
jgi:hypothetical protein